MEGVTKMSKDAKFWFMCVLIGGLWFFSMGIDSNSTGETIFGAGLIIISIVRFLWGALTEK
jgi:hypothetical protein